ncbi:MAG: DUF3300 domain-containing protein, partial [Candidatus Bruticola sp.]
MRKAPVTRFAWLFLILALCMLLPLQANAKPSKHPPQLSDIERTLAPIALYPDSLLGNVLIASTYPEQIRTAQEILDKYPKDDLDDLAKRAESQNLNESVISLLATPDVVRTMSSDMDWTYDLSNIFTNKNDEMYTALQNLRRLAYDNKKLTSNDDVQVTTENNYIYINPTNPNTMTVPTYDVNYVYGLSSPNYGYTFVNSAIQWGTFTLLNELFYGSSWDWNGRRFWWGPGYNYYRYWNNNWYPWRYNHHYYNPPPPPPRRPSYIPPPPRPPHHYYNGNRPSHGRPHADRPHPGYGWDKDRPGRPGRPSLDGDRHTRPDRPSLDGGKTTRPGRPSLDGDRYTRPDRPSLDGGKTTRPGRPSLDG